MEWWPSYRDTFRFVRGYTYLLDECGEKTDFDWTVTDEDQRFEESIGRDGGWSQENTRTVPYLSDWPVVIRLFNMTGNGVESHWDYFGLTVTVEWTFKEIINEDWFFVRI